MQDTMDGVTLFADWDPRPGYKIGPKDIIKMQSYQGSKVWRNPRMKVIEYPVPNPGPGEVLIEVKTCGICGSDVHLAQQDEEGYMLYPGLSGFPVILGHELSGVVIAAGDNAFDKWTNKPYKGGEIVCAEEMIWCGQCKPCADGYPNHCERLDEIGFNINGAFARYIVLPSKVIWNLKPLENVYQGDDIFYAGSLVEPTSVAYNAVIERGEGICPGDNVVIMGGGPVGLAACAILKRQGAAKIIIVEPEEERALIGKKLGADSIVNPLKEDSIQRVLELTNGMGASLYLEATGLPTTVYPLIEKMIWEGRVLNSKVVVVARADASMPVNGEVLQVRRASIIGAQGHSGHGNFTRVIESMGDGMDMLPMITKKINIDEVIENIVQLGTNRKECKITCRI